MRRPLLGALCGLLVVVAAPWSASAGEAVCDAPTVNALTFAESAVSRPALAAPSEYPVSSVYSIVEQATKPLFTYAEAGPQYAGAFEALVPAGTPPPPRAASAYPSEDIPDEDDETWGGSSRTEVTPVSAAATSVGAGGQDLSGATADSSRSWVVSRVDCDVVTVVAGWEANSVVLAPGASVQQLGQTLTLVVGPDGSSADVETTVVGASGVIVPSDGRPGDPFADPTRENGGPTLDAGDPRTEVGDDFARASGGGFDFFFGDPESGQGAGYSFGGLNATIDVLGVLEPVDLRAPPDPAVERDDLPVAPARVPEAVGAESAAVGTPPAPSSAALETVEAIEARTITDALVSSVTVERRDWWPLFGLIGFVALLASIAGGVQVGRRFDPTLEWVAQKSVAVADRFAAVYLRW